MSSVDSENDTQGPPQGDSQDDDIVYGVLWDAELLFLPRWWIKDQLSISDALSSGTWGEVKAALDPDTYQDLLDRWSAGDGEPGPDEPFDPDEIGGYRDGDYPTWPAQYMLDWMPDEIRQKFGSVGYSRVSGSALSLEPEDKDAIVQALEKLGYRCVEDQQLIESLSR
jgi:hypothetical protein